MRRCPPVLPTSLAVSLPISRAVSLAGAAKATWRRGGSSLLAMAPVSTRGGLRSLSTWVWRAQPLACARRAGGAAVEVSAFKILAASAGGEAAGGEAAGGEA